MTASTVMRFDAPHVQRPAAAGAEVVALRPPEIEYRRVHGVPIAIENVTKQFGDRVVLGGLNLSVRAGELIAIVGRSGCGKTTLLRLIAGLDRPTGGVLSVDDRPVEGTDPGTKLLFQDPRLLPWQRVLGNVGIGRNPGWREKAAAALRDVGLGDRWHDWPAVLSGGQRQRVSLARAIVSEPKVLLLDEPFGALDAMTRAEMHELLVNLWSERIFTGIIITHDVAEAVTLADRVIVLREGGVAAEFVVDLPRPRHGITEEAARIQRNILAQV